jgi:type VI secretion system protein ImpH
MASPIRSQTSLVDNLLCSPDQFDFFQAIRLLEKQGRAIHFKTQPSFGFLHAEVLRATEQKDGSVQLETALFNLMGPDSVLPEPIVEMALTQSEQQDPVLKDFIDSFNQRVIELAYSVWKLGEFAMELNQADSAKAFLLALCGGHLARNETLPDDAKIYYSGLLSQQNRSKESLAQMLSDFFEVPASIHSFAGEWINLHSQASQLGSKPHFNRLGVDTLLGTRIWQAQHRFLIRLGPLNYEQFLRLLPNGDWLKCLSRIVQNYVGAEYAFSTELILPSELIPKCILNNQQPFQLGWNTWLKAHKPNTDSVSVQPSA